MSHDRLDRFNNIPPHIKAQSRAIFDETQKDITANNERAAKLFDLVGTVSSVLRDSKGLIVSPEVVAFRRFQNRNGDEIYTGGNSHQPNLTPDQLIAYSDRIKSEKTAFDALDPAEQERVRNQNDPRFGNYFLNEVFKDQFHKLDK